MLWLEPSTEAGVTAPGLGFGVLGTDGCELGPARDAPMATKQQPGRELPREGVLWGEREREKNPSHLPRADGAINQVR